MQEGKTGIIWDPRTLLHKCRRRHPERPQRIKGIIKKFKEMGYCDQHPRIQYLDHISREV